MKAPEALTAHGVFAMGKGVRPESRPRDAYATPGSRGGGLRDCLPWASCASHSLRAGPPDVTTDSSCGSPGDT